MAIIQLFLLDQFPVRWKNIETNYRKPLIIPIWLWRHKVSLTVTSPIMSPDTSLYSGSYSLYLIKFMLEWSAQPSNETKCPGLINNYGSNYFLYSSILQELPSIEWRQDQWIKKATNFEIELYIVGWIIQKEGHLLWRQSPQANYRI